MPPAAISRSSTYLPKIWGNIARLHGSALGLALLLSGCSGGPEDRVLPIRAHRPPACGTSDPTTIQLEALGDFEASTLTSETLTQPSENGTDLAFPPDTRAIEARADGATMAFLGAGEVGPDGGIDFLLLPEIAACELYRPSSPRPYPLAAGGEAIGLSRAARRLLVAGGLSPSGDSARALVLDLESGEATEVPDGMIPGRAFATITELGEHALLVSGGIDPTLGDPISAPEIDDTAIVYDIAERRFDRTSLIPLSKPRARHAAVVLDSGVTLLLGGLSPGGAGAAPQATFSLEAISPIDRAARVSGLAELMDARVAPVALRLDDGRVFVGGGTDDLGQPVQSLEWLSADASEHLARIAARVAPAAAFAALPGGAVLAVGVCVPGASHDDDRPECVPGRLARQIAWVRPDGHIDALPPLGFEPAAPVLVSAADGAPFLIVSTPAGARQVLRFDPWSGRFVAPEEAPVAPAADRAPPIATDPGMFVWLSAFGDALRIEAFRHGTRGTFSREVAPLLLAGPAHLVPDRSPLAHAGVAYTGLLELDGAGGEPTPRVTIADTTYEELVIDVELEEPGATPPRIALGAAVFGDSSCPWPAGDEAHVVLRRTDGAVTLQRNGETRSCPIGLGRVSIALLAPDGKVARLKSVAVRRSSL